MTKIETSLLAERALYLVWKAECHRSAMTASAFGMPIVYIAPIRSRTTLSKIVRYILSLFQTIWVLLMQRPKIVALLNQPLPMVLIVWLYARLFGARFILDCHSAPFGWRGGVARRIYDAATRAAVVNINHNRKDMMAVEAVGGRSFLVPEIPIALALDSETPLPVLKRPNVIVVCSFMADEPIELFLAAARLMPECTFYLSGDWRKRASDVANSPENIVLLGFLSRADYLAHLATSDAIITLSNRPHIMQMAAEEALCLGRPLITNHSPILEEVFGDAALFISLDAKDLCAAICHTHRNGEGFARAMAARRRIRQINLQDTFSDIIEHLDKSPIFWMGSRI